jgi:hypothetical protein
MGVTSDWMQSAMAPTHAPGMRVGPNDEVLGRLQGDGGLTLARSHAGRAIGR